MAPPSKIILRTIRELCYNHVKGCLIIIPANSGNSLNFGLAVTRALNDQLNVNLLTLNDAYNPESVSAVHQKGLSGIVFIAKIAGAMSEKQHSLVEIYNFCCTVMENLISVGLKLSREENNTVCICNKFNNKLSEFEKRKSLPKDDFCQLLINEISNAITQDCNDKQKLLLQQGDNVVLLLNSNRVLTDMEELLFAKGVIDFLTASTIYINRMYIGNFIDCLDGTNFTATLLRVHDKQVLEYFDRPCEAPGKPVIHLSYNFCRKVRLEFTCVLLRFV